MSFSSPNVRSSLLAIFMPIIGASACGNKVTPTPDKEPAKEALAPQATASAAAVASANAGSSGERAEKPAAIPTMGFEKVDLGEPGIEGFCPIEGGLMVFKGLRVGRIVDDKVEWIGKVEDTNGFALGGTHISWIEGRFPDAVDAITMSNNGRASQPTVFPVTGKGATHTFAEGGGGGDIIGFAKIGSSTLVGGWSFQSGFDVATYRGPGLPIAPKTPEQAGCKPGEIEEGFPGVNTPAIRPQAFGSTPKGTLITAGNLCSKRGPAAEVWDKPGMSRIVDLSPIGKNLSFGRKILRGKDDEAFLVTGGDVPAIRYSNGNFEPVARLPHADLVFMSDKAELHANDHQTIHRYEEGKWIPIARLPWSTSLDVMAIEKGVIWTSMAGTIYKLRETEGIEYREGCKTPFVYLYDVAAENKLDFTFPSTRKALSTFEGVAEIGLVDFNVQGKRRLGITVTSKEQGEAVIAHVKKTMKDENPKLLCFAPKSPQVIAVKAAGK